MTEKIVAQKVCSLENCNSPQIRQGYCSKHFGRWFRHGDPHKTLLNYGEGKTFEEKFWSKVAITANPNKCWDWQAGKFAEGYGAMQFEGRNHGAHILAWQLVNKRKASLMVLHSCHRKICVNPNHLREGTAQENGQDEIDACKTFYGSRNGNSKLTDEAVLIIRRQLAERKSYSVIAKEFEISKTNVADIRYRRIWKHIK